MDKRKDIPWVTQAKFLGLYLMILGHQNLVGEEPTTFIFAFHMPLFFILSGMFSSNRSFLLTLKNAWEKLLLPFLLMTLIVVSIQTVLWIKNKYDFSGLIPYLVGSLLSPGKTFGTFRPLCITLWFLLALAEVKLIASLLTKSIYQIIAIAVCLLLALFINKASLALPLALDSMLLALPFYFMGKYAKNIFLKDLGTARLFALAIASSIVIFLLYHVNGRVDINNGIFGNNILLFYLNGLIGTAFIVYVLRVIGDIIPSSMGGVNLLINKTIAKWVSGSVLTIAFSSRITNLIKPILPTLCGNDLGGIIIAFIVVVFLYPLIMLFRRFFPKALGYR